MDGRKLLGGKKKMMEKLGKEFRWAGDGELESTISVSGDQDPRVIF